MTQHSKFSEAALEAAIIELLGKEGYPYVKGETITREPGQVLLHADLRAFLAKQYAADGITPQEIDAVVNQLEAYSAADLYESNKAIMKLVADGFLLKREDHTQKDLYIQLLDYSGLVAFREPAPNQVPSIVAEDKATYGSGNNLFKIVNQLEITGYEKRIPDGILYINGLPLVVFEFKSAIREEATVWHAYDQITNRYKRDIPELFKYNAFCVISDGANSRAGSFFANYEFWYPWRRAERMKHAHPQPLSQGEKGVNYRGGYDFSGLKKRARELRENQTPAEGVLWELLRNRQVANLKFRRQHQIGPYIVDFFCNDLKLVVELDGEVHSGKAQVKKDQKRQAYLESLGFEVLRFDNEQFLEDPEAAINQITSLLPSTFGRGAGGEGCGYGSQDAQGISSLYSMIEGLFHQTTLLDVIRNFIFIPDVSRRDEKVLCRYPQYYAATKLYRNILQHRKPEGDGKGGTYFGATGCGKSFTMLFLARLLMKSVDLSSPTIVLITDRTDLDTQLSGTFTNAKGYIGDESIISVESRDHLRELLKGRNSGGVFLTTIHKFTEDTELLTERSNVICISDEAHRSQVNLDQKVKVTEDGVKRTFGFAKYLHDSLPNATYVGFTGTPIDATLDVFGEVVDSYTMTESVADEITVPIVYEGRAAKVILDNQKLKEIEKYYDECAEAGASDYAIEDSKKTMANMGAILGDPQRIEALAADFVDHYEKRVSEGSTVAGKALFVSSSRQIAYDFYQQVIKLRPEWAEVRVAAEGVELTEQQKKEILPMERLKMVMTRGKDDEKALYDLLGNKDDRKKFDTQFKKAESNFKIAIVVDMWLTGFDVPFLDTIYIDKPVQRHNLIQTISRVNRKFENRCNVRQVPARIQFEKGLESSALRAVGGKDAALFPDSCVVPRSLSSLNSARRALDSGKITRGLRPAPSRTMHAKKGLVVDYIGIKKQMNLALAHYSKADSSNIEEIEASIVVVRDHLDLLGRVFHQFDTKPYFSGSPVEQLECLNKAAEFVQLTDKIEKRVMFLVKRLKAAYDICSGTDVFTQSERDHIHFYLAVRSIVAKLTKGEAPDSAQMNAKVREMISEALQSDGIEEIFKLGEDGASEIDIFDEYYLAKIEKIKLPNTKIKLLQQLLKKAIEDFKKANKTKGVDFSEQFQSLVSKYNERDEKDGWTAQGVKDLTDEFFTMVENLKTEMGSFNDLGIDLEEKSFYDILKKLADKYEFDYPEDKLIKLAKEVKTVVDDKARFPAWNQRVDIKAELKVGLILLLAEHGYPPVDRDEVYKEIFEQAESFKKYKMQGS